MYQQNQYTPIKIKYNERLVLSKMLSQYSFKVLIGFITWFDSLTAKYS